MNANELADEVQLMLSPQTVHGQTLNKAATTLRQQQAEIEALKSVVYWLKENRPEVWDDIQKWRKL